MTDTGNIRGIEHVGITVPDHAQAVMFFRHAFGAELLFSLTDKQRDPLPASDVGPRNGLSQGTAIVAVSMLRLANGANLEVFEIDRPHNQRAAGISDIGISHFSITVEDIEAAGRDFAAAGGTLLAGPYDLTDQEAGPENRGRFGLTPWGLLIEMEQLPSPVKCDREVRAGRWLPAPGALQQGTDGSED